MTTSRDYAPVLDRLLQREVSTMVEVAGVMTFAYDTQELMSGGIDDGEWRRDSDTVLGIGLNDSKGLSFPDLTLPAQGVEVSWDGETATILNVTGMVLLRDLNAIPIGILLTFDGTLPVAGTALEIVLPTAGTQMVMQTVQRQTWAARRDYRGRDFLRITSETNSLIGITSTRFIVRAEGPAWVIQDVFTDDQGETQTVQGIGEIGRGRWLELLTQAIG